MKIYFKVLLSIIFLCSSLFSFYVYAEDEQMSDEAIAQFIISLSIQDYLNKYGNCPCPYNTQKNGSLCGKVSAWYRPGGHAPYCYVGEVPQSLIDDYRYKIVDR